MTGCGYNFIRFSMCSYNFNVAVRISINLFQYLGDDRCVFEREPLEQLAAQGKLQAYRHDGFWQCMDTLGDRKKVEALLEKGKAPWKIWEN